MLVIFDCDGVLIDSEAIFCAVDAEALTRLGHPTTAATISERFAGVPHQMAWRQLSAELNLQLPQNWIDDLLLECQRRFPAELAPIPGAASAVTMIVEGGDQVCVASSTELPSLRENLERTGLLSLLAPHVFSVDQVKRPKPAPDVFLFAASQMGFDPADTHRGRGFRRRSAGREARWDESIGFHRRGTCIQQSRFPPDGRGR